MVSHSSILHWMLSNFVDSDADCSSLSRKFRESSLHILYNGLSNHQCTGTSLSTACRWEPTATLERDTCCELVETMTMFCGNSMVWCGFRIRSGGLYSFLTIRILVLGVYSCHTFRPVLKSWSPYKNLKPHVMP